MFTQIMCASALQGDAPGAGLRSPQRSLDSHSSVAAAAAAWVAGLTFAASGDDLGASHPDPVLFCKSGMSTRRRPRSGADFPGALAFLHSELRDM